MYLTPIGSATYIGDFRVRKPKPEDKDKKIRVVRVEEFNKQQRLKDTYHFGVTRIVMRCPPEGPNAATKIFEAPFSTGCDDTPHWAAQYVWDNVLTWELKCNGVITKLEFIHAPMVVGNDDLKELKPKCTIRHKSLKSRKSKRGN